MKYFLFGVSAICLMNVQSAWAMNDDIYGFKGLKLVSASKMELGLASFGLKLNTVTFKLVSDSYQTHGFTEKSLNLFFNPDKKIQPFITAKSSNSTLYNPRASFGQYEYGDDASFNIGTGLRYQMSDGFYLDGAYNFVNNQSLGLNNYRNDRPGHEFRLGFTWNFN